MTINNISTIGGLRKNSYEVLWELCVLSGLRFYLEEINILVIDKHCVQHLLHDYKEHRSMFIKWHSIFSVRSIYCPYSTSSCSERGELQNFQCETGDAIRPASVINLHYFYRCIWNSNHQYHNLLSQQDLRLHVKTMCVQRKPLLKEHTEKEKEEAKMNELKIVNSKQGSCDRK